MRMLRTVLPTVLLFILAFGGYVKGTWPLSALPVDITLAAAAGAAVFTLQRMLSPGRRYPVGAVLTCAVLVTALVLGLLGPPLNSYASAKWVDVLVVLPACLLGGLVLLGSPARRRVWLTCVLFLGPVLVVLALVDPDPLAYGRLWPEGSSTIGVGRSVGAALVVSWCLVLTRRKVGPLALLSPVLVWALVMSESRGPMVATLVAVAVVSIASSVSGKRAVLAGGAAVVGTAVTALVIAPERFTSLTDASASIRFKLWAHSAELAVHNPLRGIGWGNLYDHEPAELRLPSGFVQYPHSSVLEIASEAGLLAAAAFLVAVGAAIRSQWRAAEGGVVELGMLGLLIFFFVNSLASGDIGSNRELWVAIGCAWGGRLSSPSATAPDRPAGREDHDERSLDWLRSTRGRSRS